MALVALALAWAARSAALLLGPRIPARNAHGHLAKPWFRIGFDQIRRLLRSNPIAAIAPWLRLTSAPLQKSSVV
jgi:hypothetical protein